ncbi:Highly reducing polyketide synthase alt5 [Cladobotryum mycophilum]|uniref:Highly reducing polyketide synthase alt5 n=1 Tax=Cladobotryum mycophilum TaxID=491253 RepID=A0ABR0T4P1_9HYPO
MACLLEHSHDGFGTSPNDNLAGYIGLGSTKNPNLAILEIGAGTGATTNYILQKAGQKLSNYTFTDISAGFLAAATNKFATHASVMDFKTLDIEQDPIGQGFQPESFDLIVAANVLHATSKMRRTLAHVKKLLRPGGKLLLLELTLDHTAASLIMGSLPGWWLGEDDGRKGGPLLGVDQWDKLLRATGFTGIDLDMRGSSPLSSSPVSFMVSTKLLKVNNQITTKRFSIITRRENAGNLTTDVERQLSKTGVDVSICPFGSPVPDGNFYIVLLEESEPLLSRVTDDEFHSLQDMIQNSSGMVWVTRGATMECASPHRSLILGLARSIRNERAGFPLGILDLDVAGEGPRVSKAIIDVTLKIALNPDADFEYAFRRGQILVPRAVRRRRRPIFNTAGGGTLDTNPSVDELLHPDWVELDIKAAELNQGSLRVSIDAVSGIVTKLGENVHGLACGEKVSAALFTDKGAIQQRVRLPAAALLRTPDMNFEAAASIPVDYLTAYSALVTLGNLREGESILINSRSGSLSQAAVVIATSLHADIYAAVRSDEERKVLHLEYGVPEHRIISASSLVKSIMGITNEKGVDLVLGSHVDDSIAQALKCVARFGRFISVAETGSQQRANLNIDLGHSRSFTSVNLDDFLEPVSLQTVDIVHGVQRLLDQGIIRAVQPPKVFKFSEVMDAVRHSEHSHGEEKVVIKRGELEEAESWRVPEVNLKPSATYMIAGLGGVGRDLGWWLAKHGAKNLVFASRSAATGSENQVWVNKLKNAFDVTIMAFDCDIADREALSHVLASCSDQLPPIHGVITGAMELQDSLFEQMTPAAFRAAVRPKVAGSWNLHELLPDKLDFFVMLSSIIGVTGLRGQANYNAGNTFQDALAHYRASRGLPAVSIDLGYIPGVGFVTRNDDFIRTFRSIGIQVIETHELHALLGMAIRNQLPDEYRLPPQIITCLPSKGGDEPYYWLRDAKFSLLRTRRRLLTQTESSTVSFRAAAGSNKSNMGV